MATTATMATNSAGFMEMSATANVVASSARLPCRTSASSTTEMRPLAHVGHAARLVDAQSSLGNPPTREQEQAEQEQAGEDAERAQPQPRTTWSTPPLPGWRPPEPSGCDETVLGVAAAGAGAGDVGAAMVVAGATVVGMATGSRHGDHQARHAGERRRHAGRVVGRGDRAESREAVDVRRRRS